MIELVNLIKKLRVPEFLVPKWILTRIEVMLVSARIKFSAKEWVGMFLALGAVLFLIGLFFSLFTGILLFVSCTALIFLIPKIRINKRRAVITAVLPDVLHHMAVSVRTGLVLESVVGEIAEAEYGALSDEFSQIVVEMKRGRPLKEAMLGFSRRSGSKEVERAIRLLLEGVEFGGPIADVLDEVSEDMRAVRMIQRERKSMTSQQVSFLAMASLLAGPFVMGVVAALPVIMAGATAGYGESQLPLAQMSGIITALSFYVIAQACSASIMIGVVMYGDFKKGFKFMLPMAFVAYTVFFLIKTVMPNVLAAI
ncbi:MAG: type II secretion system F family protein [Candidatus Hydrothermarchaeota archaeon]|nr:type II secretion system F family protein [Candidatus Hydrothermarchaeota archaeon]